LNASKTAPVAALLAAALLSSVAAHAADLERGRTLFANYCVACHGPTGKGSALAKADLKPPPPRLLSRSDATPVQYYNQIHDGSRQMPQMHDELSDADILNIVYALPEITGQHHPNWQAGWEIDSQ